MPLTTEEIWQQLGDSLRGFLRRRAAAGRVDDLLQEVFLRVHRGLDQLADAEHVGPWVYRIARNVLVDDARARRPETIDGELPEPLAHDAHEAGEEPPGAAIGAVVARMAENLPETYREAIRLHELLGLPQREVAQRLGLTLPGAKSRIQRGRQMLRGMLLACCHVEFDRRANPIALRPRRACPVCACDDGTCDEGSRDEGLRGEGTAPPDGRL